MIVMMAGLPGTGKTTLSTALARSLGGVVLNKDTLRADLFPANLIEYSAVQDDFVQDLMQRTAQYLLARNPSLIVFFDGRTFSRKYQIRNVIDTAEKIGTPWRIIECVCPEQIALARIRAGKRHPAKNRTAELYFKVRDSFEPIEDPKVVVDTGGSIKAAVRLAQGFLTSNSEMDS
jgi:predicted kinase